MAVVSQLILLCAIDMNVVVYWACIMWACIYSMLKWIDARVRLALAGWEACWQLSARFRAHVLFTGVLFVTMDVLRASSIWWACCGTSSLLALSIDMISYNWQLQKEEQSRDDDRYDRLVQEIHDGTILMLICAACFNSAVLIGATD